MDRSFIPHCVFSVLLLTSCQEDPEPSAALFKERWKLNQIGNTPVAVSSYSYDYDSYIEFKTDSSAEGLATCTSFSSTFTHDASSQQLSFGMLNLGTPTCSSPTIAARYLAALPTIVRYEVSADMLRLYGAQDPKPQLVFKAE